MLLDQGGEGGERGVKVVPEPWSGALVPRTVCSWMEAACRALHRAWVPSSVQPLPACWKLDQPPGVS